MRYRNVEGVRMTEQTDRSTTMEMGTKKNMRMLREAWSGRGGGGGVQVRRGKNPRQGESLDKD